MIQVSHDNDHLEAVRLLLAPTSQERTDGACDRPTRANGQRVRDSACRLLLQRCRLRHQCPSSRSLLHLPSLLSVEKLQRRCKVVALLKTNLFY